MTDIHDFFPLDDGQKAQAAFLDEVRGNKVILQNGIDKEIRRLRRLTNAKLREKEALEWAFDTPATPEEMDLQTEARALLKWDEAKQRHGL